MRDLIDAPHLGAFADNEGSTFTVSTSNDAELILDEVDMANNSRRDWEQFTLIFRGPSDDRIQTGIHRFDHPRLDAFDMDLRPVCVIDSNPDVVHYQTSVTRPVPDREPSRSSHGTKSSRRGFFGTLAAVLGGAGLLGGLFGPDEARANSRTAGSAGVSIHDPTIGQITMFGGNFAPRSWAFCEGQLLAISANTALFSLLGTTYGGDGRTTFALPDLRGRVPIHPGQGPGLSSRRLGENGGQEQVALNPNQMPSHSHNGSSLPVSSAEADATTPGGNALGAQPSSRGTVPTYSTGSTDGSMSVSSSSAGGGQAHDNMPPFLCVHFIIALQGVYPSRS